MGYNVFIVYYANKGAWHACQRSDPLGNQTTPRHVIQCKKYGDTPKNVFSRPTSRDPKVQGRDPIIFEAEYLNNRAR